MNIILIKVWYDVMRQRRFRLLEKRNSCYTVTIDDYRWVLPLLPFFFFSFDTNNYCFSNINKVTINERNKLHVSRNKFQT